MEPPGIRMRAHLAGATGSRPLAVKLPRREEFMAPVARLLLKIDECFAGSASMAKAKGGSLPWSADEIDGIRTAVLKWYRVHARDLPWRRTRDPYAIFVSELMLQQTQAATVIPYFERWMSEFPTWRVLAEAPLERVLKAWEGLGYYHRARNLHQTAKIVCEEYGERLPADYYRVLSLPGVGRYTVGAICSIAFGMRLPVLDGNVVRVLTRLANFGAPVDLASTQNALWRWAEALTPERHPGEFNQSLMELGALICARSNPACLLCPLRVLCRAKDPAALPVKSRRLALSPLLEDVEIVIHRGRVLVSCDPAAARWPGLWQFPRARETGPDEPWQSIKFSFTRYRGQMRAWLRPTRKAGRHERWATVGQLATAPMPAPHRKLAAAVEALLMADRGTPKMSRIFRRR